jgi:hypothetical protein
MNEDRITGQRAGIRWAIAMLRAYAVGMESADTRATLLAAASDLSRAAKALRTKELPTEGWQDIATAPRDGTRVLLAWADGAMAIAVWQNRNENLEADTYYEGWVDQFDFVAMSVEAPTHWMPLPPPPDTEDDITAGLEALSEPIVAEWGEVKDRLNLGKED